MGVSLQTLPDEHPAYVPQDDGRLMEVTVGAIRATEERPAIATMREATLLMWEFIAVHPDCRPWLNSGDTSPESEGFREFVFTNATPALRSRLNGILEEGGGSR